MKGRILQKKKKEKKTIKSAFFLSLLSDKRQKNRA